MNATAVAAGALDQLSLSLPGFRLGLLGQEPFDEVHVRPKSMPVGHPAHHVKPFLAVERVGGNRQHEGPPARGLFEVVVVAHLQRQLKEALDLENDPSEQPNHPALSTTKAGHPCVDEHHDDQARRRVGRVHAKHQHNTQHRPHQADGPVRSEGGTVTRIGRHMFQERHEANGPVRHHEEHGDDLGHGVDVAHQDKHKRNGARGQGRPHRLVLGTPALLQPGRHAGRKDLVRGDRLKRPRRHHHTAQGRAHRGRGQSNGNDGAPQGDVFHVQLVRRQSLERGAPPQLDGHGDVDHNAHHGGPNGAFGNAGTGVFQIPTQPKPSSDASEGGKYEGEDFEDIW